MLITSDGTIIRTPVDGIPVYGRNTGGVIVMKTADDSHIANFALVAKEEPEVIEGEAPAEEAEAEKLTAESISAENESESDEIDPEL